MSAYIYQMIEEAELQEMLNAFHLCVKLPVCLLDEQGKPLIQCGTNNGFCNFFQKFLKKEDSCEIHHAKAASQALRFGEAYIFECHSNLNHIVFPLVQKNTLIASVLVGPFLMDEPDMNMFMDISERYHTSTPDILELYERSSCIKVIEAKEATQISILLSHLFSKITYVRNETMLRNRRKQNQQSQINDAIKSYKDMAQIKSIHYPIEKEKMLIHRIRTGNIQEARAILNDLFGYVLFSKGHSIKNVKARAIELCSLLSRAALEGAADESTVFELNNDFLDQLPSLNNYDDLCLKLQEMAEAFVRLMFERNEYANHEAVQRAIIFMGQNFDQDLTLSKVAIQVYLNPAYFSTIFKKSTGMSFKEYLTKLRVDEAKRLLTNTDYTILDIAVACGFDNQSYFSKVFKKYTGFSPKAYRSE
ncbi:MAG: PocR ligand-binding domain-containing protein [Blautia sp.]|nr:PocR ligand-binding domain-containing protein [Blautia sp.]